MGIGWGQGRSHQGSCQLGELEPLIGRRPFQRKDVVCAKALGLQRVRWARDGVGVGVAHRRQMGKQGQLRLEAWPAGLAARSKVPSPP